MNQRPLPGTCLFDNVVGGRGLDLEFDLNL